MPGLLCILSHLISIQYSYYCHYYLPLISQTPHKSNFPLRSSFPPLLYFVSASQLLLNLSFLCRQHLITFNGLYNYFFLT